ncbi:polymeric immunoglobulin receptor-like isoform X4, partial [Clarias magur]
GGDSKAVTGYSGGRVLIKCKYDTEYTQNKKYFCKGSWSGCSDQIKTEDKNKWINSGRFSLYDDTKSAEFWVMIRNLTVQDTGTYHCSVDISYRTDSYIPVELKVNGDLSYEKSISETVHAGGALNISCKYPESIRSHPKFLCNTRLQESVCFYKKSVNESGKYVNLGKFSLYDDRERQILSVSIRNVTARDSGEYWCGAEAAWESDQGYKVYFTQINLTVTEPYVPVSTLKPMHASSSPSSSSSSSSSAFTSTSSSSSQFTSVSPATGFPVVIPVSVILLLLLFAILFLLVILTKRRKIQASRPSSARRIVQSSENDNR